jgi:hypothetical protein
MGTWQGKTWQISAAAPRAAEVVIKKSNGSSNFKLVPVKRNNQIISYKVDFNTGGMTKSWKDCVLLPRGIAKPQRPAQLPLPPFGPASEALYNTVIGLVLNQVRSAHFNTERLEGDLTVNGTKEGVTLYRVDDAIQGAGGALEDLLIIDLESDKPNPLQPREDGVAHGHPF